MFMFREKILIIAYFFAVFLLVHFPQSSNGNRNRRCNIPPSSCGSIQNISYPFRLKGDPKQCGDFRYELDCEAYNTTVLRLSSQKYYVQAINYDNFTIRLVDANLQEDNCSSFPQKSLYKYNLSRKSPYSIFTHKWEDYLENRTEITKAVIFITCPYPVPDSPLSAEVPHNCTVDRVSSSTNNSGGGDSASSSSLVSSGQSTYVNVGKLFPYEISESCNVDLMVMTSFPPLMKEENDVNLSFSDIRHALLYGFQLSWFKVQCQNCSMPTEDCFLNDHNQEICLDSYCDINIRFLMWSDCGIRNVLKNIARQGLPNLVLYVIGLSIAARILCGIPCTITFLIYKLRRRNLSMFDTIESYLQSQNNLMPIRYSYSEIKKMTKGFKDKLGEGGYGSVYKGKLRSDRLAAIKVLSKPKANGQDFINEVSTIGRIHHLNVVQLIGFCAESSKRALVYEFMPNGSLEKYLNSRETNTISLRWERKHEIVLGVARGIEYLHRGCDIQILHFDIKPHNILLDDNFVPKVSDFGLAKLYPTDKSIVTLTAARGTIGYVAPELINRSIGGVSYKADVYSFGMLLMEMVGVKRNLITNRENSSQYFPFWVYDNFRKGKDIEMADIATDDERKITRKMTLVALWCIQMNPVNRPSMTKVVEMLQGEVEHLEMPPPETTPEETASFQDPTSSSGVVSSDLAALLCNSFNSISLEITTGC